MRSTCNLYESLFIFRTEAELKKHLGECEICRKKNDEMMQVEHIIRSAKPLHIKDNNKVISKHKRILASVVVLFTMTIGFTGYSCINNSIQPQFEPKVADIIDNSYFNVMNLPTDDYGVLNPHEELNYEQVSYKE